MQLTEGYNEVRLMKLATDKKVRVVKKLVLLIVTSFVAIGTSAVGIQGESRVEVRPVVAIVESNEENQETSNSLSVVRWR